MMRKMWASVLALVLVVSLAAPVAAQRPAAKTAPAAAPAPLDGLDAFVNQLLKDWQVPGLAVAVVKDGQVILSKGYGLRDVQRNLPVTPQTLFAIGSITKSFTCVGLGLLADEGKLDWEQPVRRYLPEFQLWDAVASERMTPRDLVTHRSGLPRHDAVWYGSNLSRQQMFERLRYLEPSRDFRSAWQYQNLMFMTAGYLAGRLAGMSWEEWTRRRILEPLGMTRSNFSVRESEQTADHARPYMRAGEEVKEVPFRLIDEIGPAGSINSNVEEMIRYVQFYLNGGKFGERQILSAAQVAEMQAPQMVMGGPTPWPEVGHASYGLGLVINTYRGRKLVSHGGGIDGFTALLSFLPAERIGMIILTNRGGTPAPTILSYHIYDRLLGLEPVDWSQRFQEQERKQREAREEARRKGYTDPRPGTRPSHELAEYAGEYEHPGYGIARVTHEGGELKLQFNSINAPLKHFHYDVFAIPPDPGAVVDLERKVQFFTNLRGEVASLAVPLEPNVKEIVFTRRPEKPAREVLESLAGSYELGPAVVTVALKDEALTLTVPGQPTYELVPTRGLVFELKGRPGYSVEFKRDAAGRVAELVFFQPTGTLVAKRR